MAQQTFEELVDAVKQAESRGKRYKDDGKTLTTSSKGALGEMQVMPKTIRDPGFGVTPARDKSPDEIARVGVDYLQAMKQKYGDTEKALIAYNWGPGSTDKWLASGADPKKLPAETRTYVERVKGFLGKDVPRETSVAKKEREPLPASLPPMAQADIKTPSVKPEAAARVASLGPGYQAALALSFLAETDDEEDRKTTITQEYLAKAQEDEDDLAAAAAVSKRQSNVFADLSNTTIRSPFAEPQQPVRMKDGGDVGDRLTPQQIEQYVGQKTKAQLLLEKFKEQAHPRNYTSIIGLGPNIAYETYKYATGKDPLRELQKELQKKIDYEVDTGSEPIGTDSGPISGSLPPIRRADGSPEEGEDVSKPYLGNPNISRQVGQARRNAAIQKANYRDEVAEAKDTARKGEAYQELEKYLQSRNAVPDIKVTGYLPEGTHGMFSSDRTNIGTGDIKISKNLHETYMPSTIAHEVTHAADRQMEQQAMEQGLFGKSNQFTEAYKKMVGKEGRNRTQLLRKRYPEFEEDNRYYRSRPDEVAAHAIGAYSGPVMQDSAPRHVDATAATEFRILMDLAQRNVDKGPKGLDKILPFFRKFERYADGGVVHRADGSPKEGERKLDRETMDMLRRQGTSPASLQRVAPPADISSSAAGLPGLMLLADPRIDNTNAYGYVLDSSDDKKNFGMAQAMFLNKSRSEDYPDTIAHETEHLLARQNLGSAASINSKFDELIGNKGTSRLNFVRDAVKAAPYLKEKYDLQSSYLDPKMFEYQTKFGLGKNLLYEQLASLAALEQRHKIDLTKDPELRKTLFSRPDVRETYNALTGLRQTRLDPRDLPPHTRVPEPGMLDAIKGVFKRADGGPVYRAEGSPEEGERLTPQQIERLAAQEAAEREAASTPAFIAQKSGIGRKAGPVSQALQSGQGQIEFLKGMTNVPQNILGAPMDISNMIANVYGGGVEKPFMGSEYIKEGLRKKGLGFTPSTDPTLAAFYGAGDLGSNLVNPAGATRAGVQAAGKTGEAAKMLARDFQQYNQELAVPGASYAIRNRSTPFIMTPERTTVSGQIVPEMNEADAYADRVARTVDTGANLRTDNPALANWFRTKVGAYLRRDFGTEQDQMVQAADKGLKMHFTSPRFLENNPYLLNPNTIGTGRELEGFPKAGFAKTAKGQEAEAIVDSSIYPLQLQDVSEKYVPANMRQFIDTNPEMRLSEMGSYVDENLKLELLADEMDNMFKETVFKAYGEQVPMPKDYILTEDTLKGLTPAQASNRVARKQEWVTEKRGELAGIAISKDPQIVSHSYDNGSKWISPPDLANNARHEEMVKDIGCAGGWCTDKSTYALDFGSGENRLNILLDKKFEPRVQLTVNSPPISVREFILANPHLPEIDALTRDRTLTSKRAEEYIKTMPEYQDFVKQNQNTKSITEIKGQFNNADLKKSPYLKEIQDFVKRQGPNLQSVHNQKDIRMVDMRDIKSTTHKINGIVLDDNLLNRFLKVNGNSYFADQDEYAALIKKASEMPNNEARQIQMNMFQPPTEKALGGMIERQPDDNRRYM